MITPQQLAEWERLCEAATAGPWDSVRGYEHPVFYVVHRGLGGLKGYVDVATTAAESDADFCAAARTAVPACIAALRERDAEIAELRLTLSEFLATAREVKLKNTNEFMSYLQRRIASEQEWLDEIERGAK